MSKVIAAAPVNEFRIIYQPWSAVMGGNGIAGTIRTTPENYYVATINASGEIIFNNIEACTRSIDQDKVRKLWADGKIPKTNLQ